MAGRLRATFLASTVQRSGKAHMVAVLKLLLDEHFQAWLDDASLQDVEELARLIDARLTPASGEEGTVDDRMAEVERDLRGALDSRRSPDALAGALLTVTAQDREFAVREGYGWGDERCRRYLDFLIAQDYEPTPTSRSSSPPRSSKASGPASAARRCSRPASGPCFPATPGPRPPPAAQQTSSAHRSARPCSTPSPPPRRPLTSLPHAGASVAATVHGYTTAMAWGAGILLVVAIPAVASSTPKHHPPKR